MDEEKPQNGYWGKLAWMVTNQLTGELWRFTRGVVQWSAAVAYGPAGVATATAVFSALSGFRYFSGEQQARKNILQFYSQEISNITGKPISQLSLVDVEQAARYQPNGQKNAIALELEAAHRINRHNLQVGIVGILGVALLGSMAAAVVPVTAMAGAGMMIAGAAFGIASNLIFMTVDHVVTSRDGAAAKYEFADQLKDMVKQTRFRPVPMEQVFDLLLKSHSDIRQSIKNRYGKSYTELTFATKTDIARQYEDVLHAQLLADRINSAQMNVQELGFIAYGQSSGGKALPSGAVPGDTAVSHSANHAEQLQQQRSQKPSLTLVK